MAEVDLSVDDKAAFEPMPEFCDEPVDVPLVLNLVEVATASQPEQTIPSVLAMHDSSFGPPDPVTSASAIASDGDPSEAPASAPPPRGPDLVDHGPVVDTKVNVKTTAVANLP